MRLYLCNVILTLGHGQAILDLRVPLDAGEEVNRAFFLGIVEALHPTLPVTLRGEGYTAPAFEPLTEDQAERARLVKVSMAVTDGIPGANRNGAPELPGWFRACEGKLYFHP